MNKTLFHNTVRTEQSRFMEERKIMDGILVAHDMVHSLSSSRSPGMLIKLDISKSYNYLNWDYLLSILTSFGFSSPWISWVKFMISTPFYYILVNEAPCRTFCRSRGVG